MIKEIFSVPIYEINNKSCLLETLNALNKINIEQYYAPKLYGMSGFTTYYDNEASQNIKNLIPNTIKFILHESKNYLHDIGYSTASHKINFRKAWFSRMNENSNHGFHLHTTIGDKEQMLCGTYYLKISKDSAPLTFSRSEGEFFNQPKLPFLKENKYTRKFYSHYPIEGDLVLFLAETFHGVLGNKSIGNRDTLSFNITVTQND